jgi:hypothetical protein
MFFVFKIILLEKKYLINSKKSFFRFIIFQLLFLVKVKKQTSNEK